MRRFASLLALACLSCSSAGDDAAKEYDIVAKNGDSGDQCRAATKAADAYLAEQNVERYQHWKLIADSNCLHARVLRQSGL